MIREIVTIDEELCDGCGQCIPACEEGALRLVNGKAKLVSDRLCDGLGACLGECPQGAIRIEHREADAFDEAAVAAHAPAAPARNTIPAMSAHAPAAGGCPGSRLQMFEAPAHPAAVDPAPEAPDDETPSQLRHWPVQLRLLPAEAPVLREARLLVAADCVPIAYADFQSRLLRGRTVVIGCPKFDDLEGYIAKLTDLIRKNDLREIVVARMEVPCCMGIVTAVHEARRQAGSDVKVTEIVIGTRGRVVAERKL